MQSVFVQSKQLVVHEFGLVVTEPWVHTAMNAHVKGYENNSE